MTGFEQVTDWDKIGQSFSAFVECPSSENAKLFLDLLPKERPTNQVGDHKAAIYFIRDYQNYIVLERETWAGSRYSAEALFRLLSLSDGAFTEDILATLGTLIRINPRLFLEVLIGYQESPFIKAKGLPIDRVDLYYKDRENARSYELEMRIKAIESVKDEKYAELIKACIGGLKKSMGAIKMPRP